MKIPGIRPTYLRTIGRLRQPVSILVATKVKIASRIEFSSSFLFGFSVQVRARTTGVLIAKVVVRDRLVAAR